MYRKDNKEISEIIYGVTINSGKNGMRWINMAERDMISGVTEDYLAKIGPDMIPDKNQIKVDLIHLVNTLISDHNRSENSRDWKKIENLLPVQIAMILKRLHHVKKINMTGYTMGSDCTLLAVYQDEGENEGIYLSKKSILIKLIQEYNKFVKPDEIDQIISYLENNCEIVTRNRNPKFAPVRNGIYDLETKQLMPFTPDIVFTAKCGLDYVPGAPNPIIYSYDDNSSWDVQSWLSEMFDYDPDMVDVIWQILSAVVCPNVKWGKCVWLLSVGDDNDRDMICELIHNLVGNASCVELRNSDFEKDHVFEPMLHASALIVNKDSIENFIDTAESRAMVSGDTIMIDKEGRMPVMLQPNVFVIQSADTIPKDQSESFYRRQMIIEFKRLRPVHGQDRNYIKDYLKRKDVLEYVLWRVLNMDHYEITETPSMRDAMKKYTENNESVQGKMDHKKLNTKYRGYKRMKPKSRVEASDCPEGTVLQTC